jgi:hypothetical protein
MRTLPVSSRPCCLLGTALAVLLGWSVQVRAVDPEKMNKADDSQAPAKAEPPPTPEKTYKFEMRDKPWMGVIEWFADTSGLMFVGTHKPTGTFNFIAPKGGPREYTLAQIVDIINEGLQAQPPTQKYILIRRDASFLLWPAADEIDPMILRRVDVK